MYSLEIRSAVLGPQNLQDSLLNSLLAGNLGREWLAPDSLLRHIIDKQITYLTPSTGLPVGIYEVGGRWPSSPDLTLGTVFIVTKYVGQGNSGYTLVMFDMTHFVPVDSIPFSTVQSGISVIGRFIRWGTNGLALSDKKGNVYLISAPFVNAPHTSQLPTAQ
jgi:hypothetical protein